MAFFVVDPLWDDSFKALVAKSKLQVGKVLEF
jgi:hypothetical protein